MRYKGHLCLTPSVLIGLGPVTDVGVDSYVSSDTCGSTWPFADPSFFRPPPPPSVLFFFSGFFSVFLFRAVNGGRCALRRHRQGRGDYSFIVKESATGREAARRRVQLRNLVVGVLFSQHTSDSPRRLRATPAAAVSPSTFLSQCLTAVLYCGPLFSLVAAATWLEGRLRPMWLCSLAVLPSTGSLSIEGELTEKGQSKKKTNKRACEAASVAYAASRWYSVSFAFGARCCVLVYNCPPRVAFLSCDKRASSRRTRVPLPHFSSLPVPVPPLSIALLPLPVNALYKHLTPNLFPVHASLLYTPSSTH